MLFRSGGSIGKSDGERLGTLSQCPPLPAVVVAQAGLSGKVHHVVLFTGATGTQKQVREEREKEGAH